MSSIYIYALVDPRNQEVRYIGSTTNPKRRYEAHCSGSHTDELRTWILELREIGLLPEIDILEETEENNRLACERHWINRYRQEGPLFNSIVRGRPPGIEKKAVSYRLTETALDLLSALAKRYGLNNSDMLGMIIRDHAHREKL